MWLFKRSVRKKRLSAPVPEEQNRVLELANSLRGEAIHLELERRLGELDFSTLTSREQESWWHLYGLTAFQTGRETEAQARFEEGYRRFPYSSHLRFSLGQQYIRKGAIEQGFALFRECRFPDVPREYALMQARYAYLWSRYDDGMLFIKPFMKAYEELKVLDDHFLYVRGLPFFQRYWGYLACFCILAAKAEELERITSVLSRKCYECDFEDLWRKMVAYRDNKPDMLLEPLERQLATGIVRSPQEGLTRMKIAIIKAGGALDLEAAERSLSEANLTDNDGWLEEIRTLALAEAAHRFGDHEREEGRANLFRARQPLLLEPDVAISLHMLRYQERLKIRYQAAVLNSQ